MQRTAQKGGLKSSYNETPPTRTDARSTAPAQRKTDDAGRPDPLKLFTRNDLRPQVSPASELARAVAEVFASLDPVAQKYVKPASMLRHFLEENDATLAKMFKESHARP